MPRSPPPADRWALAPPPRSREPLIPARLGTGRGSGPGRGAGSAGEGWSWWTVRPHRWNLVAALALTSAPWSRCWRPRRRRHRPLRRVQRRRPDPVVVAVRVPAARRAGAAAGGSPVATPRRARPPVASGSGLRQPVPREIYGTGGRDGVSAQIPLPLSLDLAKLAGEPGKVSAGAYSYLDPFPQAGRRVGSGVRARFCRDGGAPTPVQPIRRTVSEPIRDPETTSTGRRRSPDPGGVATPEFGSRIAVVARHPGGLGAFGVASPIPRSGTRPPILRGTTLPRPPAPPSRRYDETGSRPPA